MRKSYIAVILVVVLIVIGIYYVYFMPVSGGEVCNNGRDDDGDTLVDCLDSDCFANPVCGGAAPYAVVTYMNAPSTATVQHAYDIQAKIKNTGGQRATFLVEGGLIPKTVAHAWGFMSVIPLSVTSFRQCCAGQNNVQDQWVELNPGEESELLTFKVTAPYSGIKDECFDNVYYTTCNTLWGGEDYVAYISTHSGCYPGQQNYEYQLKGVTMYCW